jgi:hypothetical protein
MGTGVWLCFDYEDEKRDEDEQKTGNARFSGHFYDTRDAEIKSRCAENQVAQVPISFYPCRR